MPRGNGLEPVDSSTRGRKGKKKTSDDDSVAETELDRKSAVIDGADIQALSVKLEDLERIQSEIEEQRQKIASQSNSRSQKLLLRKSETKKSSNTKKITVARRNDYSEWPEETRPKGIQFDNNGNIKEWSIIGSKEQYLKSALLDESLDENTQNSIRKILHNMNLKDEFESNEIHSYSSHVKNRTPSKQSKFNESNALDNWRENMILRKKQQGFISGLLGREVSGLVTAGAELYREKQETRDFIERAIPSIEYGKGFRVGSEFWREYETIGDKNTGLKMSLKLSERGVQEDIVRIGKSEMIKAEVGENYSLERGKSAYLEQRKTDLSSILTELEPHKPDYDQMVVRGSSVNRQHQATQTALSKSTSLAQSESSRNSESGDSVTVIGPGIKINGEMNTHLDQTEKTVRVTFNSITGIQAQGTLELVNCGSTVIFYDWTRIATEKSFSAQRKDDSQRFYFDGSPGSILPGNCRKIPFIFKSPNGGVFSEDWILTPRPALGSFKVTLRGNSELPDFNLRKRQEIQNRLAAKEAQSAAQYVVENILREVRTPPRTPSPDCLYWTERENFEKNNPGFFYDFDKVERLKEIWCTVVSSDYDWDLDLKVLRRKLFTLEDFDQVEELQRELNEICRHLASISIPLPALSIYEDVKRALADGVDRLSDQILWLRQTWNIAPPAPFPLLQRPSSSVTSMMSLKDKKDEKNVRKTPSGTRKANSGKGKGKESKEDKNKAKGKKNQKSSEKIEQEPPKDSSRMSNHSAEGLVDLSDPENSELRRAIQQKFQSVSREILSDTFDHVAALLTME